MGNLRIATVNCDGELIDITDTMETGLQTGGLTAFSYRKTMQSYSWLSWTEKAF